MHTHTLCHLKVTEDLASSEKARRALQSEKDELQDELASGGAGKYVFVCFLYR